MDTKTKKRFLLVCLGNICRSQMAEGILKSKVKKLKLNWDVESCGTSNEHEGEPPHDSSIKVAKENNIDISKNISKPFKKEYNNEFDHIYYMDEENYKDAKEISGSSWNQSKSDLLLNLLDDVKDKNVTDPWYGGEDGFYVVFKQLERACDKIVEKFK